jgi:hypothetical protein
MEQYRMHRQLLASAILIALNGCKLPTALDDPGLVSNLRFSPSGFDSFRTNTEIRYTLKAPATVSIFISKRDSLGREFLVKSLIENVNETKGSHSHTWLGDTNQGQFAPLGSYIGVVQIQHKRFEAAVLVFHF